MDKERNLIQKDDFPENLDILFKEIDLVQGCINRMASNSFEIKKWTVGLIAIVAGLFKTSSSSNKSIGTCLIFIMIVFVFWYLDAFFLRTERLYRKKYSWIIKKRLEHDTNYLFNLNPYQKEMMLQNKSISENTSANKINKITVHIPEIIRVMFSKTLLPFYGGLVLFCMVIYWLF